MNSHRHAKSTFNDSKITSVGPDTLHVRLGKEGEEVDSVSTINKNINTNLLLMSSVLKNDASELLNLQTQLQGMSTKLNSDLEQLRQ